MMQWAWCKGDQANGTGSHFIVLHTVFFTVLPCSAACCCMVSPRGCSPVVTGTLQRSQPPKPHTMWKPHVDVSVQAARLACVWGGQTSPFH